MMGLIFSRRAVTVVDGREAEEAEVARGSPEGLEFRTRPGETRVRRGRRPAGEAPPGQVFTARPAASAGDAGGETPSGLEFQARAAVTVALPPPHWDALGKTAAMNLKEKEATDGDQHTAEPAGRED
jgi:hypothetical protein